ncbi:hypothetical protein [Algoriphagus vanfongensis]|uniref:hypothetical protein n=1 Tax=Algoriphagus vanfongensis TaxID=426371 RepID=UPI0003F6CE01|nr:hypothetical protein [Algoriphagus vanfongensis]
MKKYLAILLISILLFSCNKEKGTKIFQVFEQKENVVDTTFLRSVNLENINLCYTTLTDLKNSGYAFVPTTRNQSDSLIMEYKRQGENFYLDNDEQILVGTYSDSELISSVWLLEGFNGSFLGKSINLSTYTVKQMLSDFPSFKWSVTGASNHWYYTNNDTTVFYIEIDRSIEQFPLDEEHYLNNSIAGVKMELSCWNIYGPNFGKKDTVSIKPIYAPLNDPHTNYYLEQRKPGIKTTIKEITTTGKKTITQQKRIGKWKNFNPDHSLESIEYYNNGELIRTEKTTPQQML